MFPRILDEAPATDACDPRWSLLQKTAESATFAKSPRLRDFLLYIGRKTIENRLEDVHEQTIGRHVFGRRPDYNPGDDNIVRVEARQLRKRLEQFFGTEGVDEPLVITIPKGAYVPHFEARQTHSELPLVPVPTPLQPPDSEFHTADGANPSAPSLLQVRPRRATFSVHPFVLSLLVGLALLGGASSTFLAVRAHNDINGLKDTRNVLWTSLFNDHATTNVICADSAWVLRQDILRHDLRLSDYLAFNWSRPLPAVSSGSDEHALQVLPLKQYTSMGDVHMVERLLQINRAAWRRTVVKSARQAQLRDFKETNTVLLGSVRSIPWEEIFSPQLNFWINYDFARQIPTVANRSPRAGEQPLYTNGAEGDVPGHDYSVIAYLPNLDHTGNVLIIAGTTMQGMEAAGQYISDPDLDASLFKVLGATPNKQPPYFEVLVNTGTMAGDPLSTKLVAYRVIKNSR